MLFYFCPVLLFGRNVTSLNSRCPPHWVPDTPEVAQMSEGADECGAGWKKLRLASFLFNWTIEVIAVVIQSSDMPRCDSMPHTSLICTLFFYSLGQGQPWRLSSTILVLLQWFLMLQRFVCVCLLGWNCLLGSWLQNLTSFQLCPHEYLNLSICKFCHFCLLTLSTETFYSEKDKVNKRY